MSLKSNIQWLIDFVMRKHYRFPHKVPNPNPVQTDFTGHYATVNHNFGDDGSYKTHVINGKDLWQPNLVGVQFRIGWIEVEPTKATSSVFGAPGYTYDFSKASAFLDECTKHSGSGADGKFQCLIMIEDRAFYGPGKPLPQDLFPDYLFTEGFTTNRTDSGAGNSNSTSFRANPYVALRYRKMIEAFASWRDAVVPNGFDKHPNFEGITQQETAIGTGDVQDSVTPYTATAYMVSLKDMINAVDVNFPKSICVRFVNFFSGGQAGKPNKFDELFDYMVTSSNHCKNGGPDVLHSNGSLNKQGNNAEGVYQYYETYKDSIDAAGSMQHDSYLEVKSTGPTVYYTMEEQFYLAASYPNPLNSDIIEVTEPYHQNPSGPDWYHTLHCKRVLWDFQAPTAGSDWSDAARVIAAHPEFNAKKIKKF